MPENLKTLPEKNTSPLARLIEERIRYGGPVSVAEYMELALAHPEHGYYMSRPDIIGPAGDFTTSPEISQMFGEMIAAWFIDIWMQMGRPEDVKLIELGPGRGTLAADIMRTISAWPDFKSAVTLHLVETSPRLREVQAATLKGQVAAWYDSFSEVPEGICFIIANEFFDALPVHQFKKVDSQWLERRIDYNTERNEFFFTTGPLDFDIANIMPEEFMQAPAGSIFEVSPASLSVMNEIAERIERCHGAMLIFDYGHAEPGLGDTLQAVSRHRYSDPLENPGAKDITAHVDFATLGSIAEEKAAVTKVVTQGQFLIALGVEARAEKLCEHADESRRQGIMTDLCRLVAPKEMGRLFKVMALTSKADILRTEGFDPAGVGLDEDEMPDNGS